MEEEREERHGNRKRDRRKRQKSRERGEIEEEIYKRNRIHPHIYVIYGAAGQCKIGKVV